MADQQPVNTNQPAAQTPAPAAAAASTRLSELHADPEWVSARLANGKDSAQAHEEDQLQRIVIGAPPDPVATAGEMTPEAAAARIKELMADPTFGQALLKGGKDSKQAHELDALQRIVAAAPETAERTPAARRAAALDQVPASPEEYAIDWHGVSPRDPVNEEAIKALTGWAHAAELTQSETSTMFTLAGRDVQKWQGMNDAERVAHKTKVIEFFKRTHGDDAPALFAGAARLVGELNATDPRFIAFLEDSGAGASLAVIEALAVAAIARYGSKK